ncbi:MAG: hypothetical protein COU28_01840 [Candidatus Magasanikbacteria bacterium CG10_big_fil_rev_8_21_14_0_10_36_16]|uniref:Uncharacterized protein n=1 Tax=Candidatus Magasanikbacteria bacterium CG10_big_fil_rev_8_21_14_0_10_36_16 TaxID=1974645 RepID=A0A2H0TYT4_9BACT|nr:MAG: hypothetical protein COU28_01840 [Candidatus Magasanikbacteria bacterium CG10_big_fil_rev_8_21_14_0_10_36_16]
MTSLKSASAEENPCLTTRPATPRDVVLIATRFGILPNALFAKLPLTSASRRNAMSVISSTAQIAEAVTPQVFAPAKGSADQ